jgi:hypothetical protein
MSDCTGSPTKHFEYLPNKEGNAKKEDGKRANKGPTTNISKSN